MTPQPLGRRPNPDPCGAARFFGREAAVNSSLVILELYKDDISKHCIYIQRVPKKWDKILTEFGLYSQKYELPKLC